MTDLKDADSAASSKRGGEDLSAQIVLAVEKRPNDLVRCTHVGGNCYRCNWWHPDGTDGYDNPAMRGMMVTTHSVRMSRFLVVTRDFQGLQIRTLSEDRQ